MRLIETRLIEQFRVLGPNGLQHTVACQRVDEDTFLTAEGAVHVASFEVLSVHPVGADPFGQRQGCPHSSSLARQIHQRLTRERGFLTA